MDLKTTEGGAPGCIDPQGEEKLQVQALAVIHPTGPRKGPVCASKYLVRPKKPRKTLKDLGR